jgi:single-stranded-DNA-specific exonuclease
LTTAGPEAAEAIARQLDQQNRQRQQIEKQILQEAEQQVASTVRLDRDAAIVLWGEGWHTGVIGIVASRLAEKYWRPTILIGTAEGQAQGSGRSIAGFHLFEALAACSGPLRTYGGHAMAAGLRLSAADVPAFREAFLAHAAARLGPEQLTPRLKVDAKASLRDVTLETARLLEQVGPFGAGNPRPVFAAPEVRLVGEARRMGRRGDHLQAYVTEGGATLRAVGWRMGQAADAVSRAGSCGIAFAARVSDFRGPPEVELHLKDLWIGRYGDASAADRFA